jgi:hypothetical protein
MTWILPECTFVFFVVEEVQRHEPQRTRRFTKGIPLRFMLFRTSSRTRSALFRVDKAHANEILFPSL